MSRPLLPLLLLALSATSVSAGELYRCTGGQGETVYTSNRSGFSACQSIGAYTPEPARAAPQAGPANEGTAAAAPKVEFRTGTGAEPPAAAAKPAAGTTITRGAVYRYERDGVVHYTNRRPAGTRAKVLFTYTETCFACAAAPGVDWQQVALNTGAYAAEVAEAAAQHGVDAALVRAVIHAESAFRKDVVSHAGAQGLMQLIPATAERFGVADPFTARQNIQGGTSYLAWLLKRFKGDVRLATAAYNAGEGAVDRYGGVPPYEETQRYVERVAILHDRYRAALRPAPGVATTTAVSAGSP